MPPTELTTSQRSHIAELERYAKHVWIDGWDMANRPVVTRTDKKGTVQYAIRKDGSGCDAVQPVVPFTEEDMYEFRGGDFHVMTRLTGIDV